MRRQDRGLSLEASMTLLENGEYGVLSSVSEAGQPYGVPVSYVVHEGCIDFHSAPEGHKLVNFKNNAQVSFCVVGKTDLLPDKFSTRYESVIVFGCITELVGVEKARSLRALIAKYSPDHMEAGQAYIDGSAERTRVFSISVDQVTGKARR
jgi:nitroimidazol reductase NimA-like FMN-containing flavoprotein (pyridoxamine 5'-phosphate oxidase superfamily)